MCLVETPDNTQLEEGFSYNDRWEIDSKHSVIARFELTYFDCARLNIASLIRDWDEKVFTQDTDNWINCVSITCYSQLH